MAKRLQRLFLQIMLDDELIRPEKTLPKTPAPAPAPAPSKESKKKGDVSIPAEIFDWIVSVKGVMSGIAVEREAPKRFGYRIGSCKIYRIWANPDPVLYRKGENE